MEEEEEEEERGHFTIRLATRNVVRSSVGFIACSDNSEKEFKRRRIGTVRHVHMPLYTRVQEVTQTRRRIRAISIAETRERRETKG